MHIYAAIMHKYAQQDPHAIKGERQQKILELVKAEAIGTQSALALRLKRSGFDCTQASVSRDIAELELVKKAGRYALPSEIDQTANVDEFAHSVKDFLRSAEAVGNNMVVAKSLPGTAQSVAEFLDKSGWDGIAGTIAGDNTIFVSVRDAAAAKKIAQELRLIMRG